MGFQLGLVSGVRGGKDWNRVLVGLLGRQKGLGRGLLHCWEA